MFVRLYHYMASHSWWFVGFTTCQVGILGSPPRKPSTECSGSPRLVRVVSQQTETLRLRNANLEGINMTVVFQCKTSGSGINMTDAYQLCWSFSINMTSAEKTKPSRSISHEAWVKFLRLFRCQGLVSYGCEFACTSRIYHVCRCKWSRKNASCCTCMIYHDIRFLSCGDHHGRIYWSLNIIKHHYKHH